MYVVEIMTFGYWMHAKTCPTFEEALAFARAAGGNYRIGKRK